jgi:hypothetical protein
MFNGLDTKKETAIKILYDELGITPEEIKRFPNGYCHSVYYVKNKNDEFVLRITSNENKKYYLGSIKWLSELLALGIPVPKILKYGQYNDMFFTIISFLPGKIVIIYTLLFCIDFMGEQGMKFNNDNIVSYNQNKADDLNLIYNELIKKI